ncbi:MAG: hypothetical protein KUG77_11195 [Nannocystaceae bacterium]|nr:hypothetical protein [Nannocystaceae bacterium]
MVVRTSLMVGLLLLTASCTQRIYFSQSLRDGLEGGVGAADSESALQYFSAHRIVLERDAKSRNERINGGRIIVRRGRMIEQVVIRRGTPGIATDWGEDWVSVSFEEGTSLVFAQAEVDRHGTILYRLRTSEGPLGAPVVEFSERGWVLASPGFDATLQIKRNAAGTRKKSRKVLRGRRLD